MLDIRNSCLIVVDVQGKLAQRMHDKQQLFKNIEILIIAAKTLDIPIIWCQQVPDALGPTVSQIARLLTGIEPVNKATFSCLAHTPFAEKLKSLKRTQLLLCGIETHICIYQTTVDLLAADYQPTVIAGAVSSRTLENKTLALERIADEGGKVSSVEMALFELLRTAEHPAFRQIAKLIK